MFLFNNPYTLSLVLSLGINLVFFAIAFFFKTDKLTDLTYSLTFLALTGLLLQLNPEGATALQWTIAGAIILWSLRLGSYLFYRILHIKKDARFDERRENFAAFLRFWLVQAIVVWAVMLPFSYFLIASPESVGSGFLLISGFIYALGMVVETVSDLQKYRFKSRPENKNRWIDTGLWKYSRHPNYFGEILVWWGLFIAVAPALRGWAWMTVLGPVTITLFLLFVSGIPLLEKSAEKRYGKNPEFRRYKTTTSILLPLPPKKN